MLVLRLSRSTQGGQKGAVLAICNHLQTFNWLPCARGEHCTPHAQQCHVCTQSHMAVRLAIFLPPPQYLSWAAAISEGKRNNRANKQGKKEESRGWSQSNQQPPPKAEEESQAGHTQKVMEDELPCEIHVFLTVCKVFPLAMPAPSGIINELFTICVLLPATLSLASSFFFFCPVRVRVLLPIAESSSGKVHLNGKDVRISEHSVAVVVVLGHCGDKTLELEHDVLHCSRDMLGTNQVKTPFPNSVKAVIKPSLPELVSLLHINPFWPLSEDVSGTATKGFFSKDF